MLYSTLAPQNSLTAYSAASSTNGLSLAAVWWPIAFILAVTYFIFISRLYKGKSASALIIKAIIKRVEEENEPTTSAKC
jgi:cytochrome bd-type quinol oxidase subunit 2